ncbi:unnamed protein product [Gongylonema pulchrum]|uniref:Uncharacterized protein n=1 Tax=Gongylonema pulchrum TaxID=637853 RepID=A0A3P6QGA2_9BILA|nr:unnamed protein product [Gongylonema pulchrum]
MNLNCSVVSKTSSITEPANTEAAEASPPPPPPPLTVAAGTVDADGEAGGTIAEDNKAPLPAKAPEDTDYKSSDNKWHVCCPSCNLGPFKHTRGQRAKQAGIQKKAPKKTMVSEYKLPESVALMVEKYEKSCMENEQDDSSC